MRLGDDYVILTVCYVPRCYRLCVCLPANFQLCPDHILTPLESQRPKRKEDGK
jgi:hypothetical protein